MTELYDLYEISKIAKCKIVLTVIMYVHFDYQYVIKQNCANPTLYHNHEQELVLVSSFLVT